MTESPETINFDQAADFYDDTRDFGDQVAVDAVEFVAGELTGRGKVLEIGVGTGYLAIPIASRGIDMVGIDVSTAMLAKLRQKAAGHTGHVRVLEADARRLPFPDDTFGGAYLRHVLHLIPDWPLAAAELCRVVEPGGEILVDAGRWTPEWQEFWAAISPEIGPEAEVIGLELARDGHDRLNDAFCAGGAEPDGTRQFTYPNDETWGRALEDMAARSPSWTWRVSDEAIDRAIDVGRQWILDRFGSLDTKVVDEFEVNWFRFRLRETRQA